MIVLVVRRGKSLPFRRLCLDQSKSRLRSRHVFHIDQQSSHVCQMEACIYISIKVTMTTQAMYLSEREETVLSSLLEI